MKIISVRLDNDNTRERNKALLKISQLRNIGYKQLNCIDGIVYLGKAIVSESFYSVKGGK